MSKTVFFVLIFTFASYVNAADQKYFKRVISFGYLVQQEESLEDIYLKFTKSNFKFSKNNKVVQKTINANKEIKNWDRLASKTKIKLYIDLKTVDFTSIGDYDQNLKNSIINYISKAKAYRRNREERSKKFQYSLFYMTSKGSFEQQQGSDRVRFNQNSSFSLGAMAIYSPNKGPFTYSSSLYYSHLNTASDNQSLDKHKIDPEIGFNIYADYNYRSKFNAHFGFDVERFNTFNIDGLVNNEILFDTNLVGYFTVGISKSFQLFKRNFYSKLSISQSFFSNRKLAYNSSVNTGEFQGQKIIIYLSGEITKKFFLHGMYKYHTMSGPSNLSANRLGIGFGYKF